jgi:hypothetical protein
MCTGLIADIEQQFFTEFATGDRRLNAAVPIEARREKIRVQILEQHKEGLPFRDSGQTYAQAYRTCYGRALDLRRVPRDPHGRPIRHLRGEPDEDPDEENDG